MTQVQEVPTQFRRINPYPGLMIDAAAWRDAHEYHRDQVRLHHLALHGWGIVQGLDVGLDPAGDATALRIEPGIGIDMAGNFVVVPAPQTFRITTRERGVVYLVLHFREVLAGTDGGAEQPTRIVEAYRLEERDRLPDEPYLELARVDFDPSHGPLRASTGSEHPKHNELDLRFRLTLSAASQAAAAGPATPHAADGSAAVKRLEPRISSLADQVRELSARVADLPGAPVPAPPPTDGAPAEVSEAVAQSVHDTRQRVESVASSVDETRQQLETARRDVDDTRRQVDDVRQRVDGLDGLLVAVNGRIDALPAPQPVGVAAASTVLRIALAEHSAPGWDAHRDGLRWLTRELAGLRDVDAQLGDPIAPAAARGAGIQVLYLSGNGSLALNDADVDGIAGVLDQGGVLIAEGCAAGPHGENGAREFAMSVIDLASRLGRQPARVDRGHGLMFARHVFAELPPGGRATARLLEAGGLVYSDADYGCAWQGGSPDHALARTAIRDALEFGVNLALYARIRSGQP